MASSETIIMIKCAVARFMLVGTECPLAPLVMASAEVLCPLALTSTSVIVCSGGPQLGCDHMGSICPFLVAINQEAR